MFQEANKSTDFLAPPGKQNDKRTTCKWQVKRRFHNCSWLSGKSGIRFRTGWKIQLCENVAGSGIVVYVFIAANAENSLCVRVCMQCCCCCHVCHMAHDFEIPYKKKKKKEKIYKKPTKTISILNCEHLQFNFVLVRPQRMRVNRVC